MTKKRRFTRPTKAQQNVWAECNTAGFMAFAHLQNLKDTVRSAMTIAAVQEVIW